MLVSLVMAGSTAEIPPLAAQESSPALAAGTARAEGSVRSIRWADMEATVDALRGREAAAEGPLPLPGTNPVFCTPANPGASEARSFAARARALNRDPGLDFEASVRQSRAAGGFGEEITGSGTFVGLSWDVLSSGLLENQKEAAEFRARARAESLRAESAVLDRRGRCRTEHMRDLSAPFQLEILTHRIEWLERYKPHVRLAYLRGDVLLDGLLQVDEELEEARREF